MDRHPGEISYRLRTGVLRLAMTSEPAGPALVRVAERINPRRSFLFVSTVLGRHIPVRPQDHFGVVERLVGQMQDLDPDCPVLVIGYAETAVGLGAAVARRISGRFPKVAVHYLSTTRHPVKGLRWVGFSEWHSHAPAHEVMDPAPSGPPFDRPVTLVLVDDETTTGATFLALIAALQGGGLSIQHIHLMMLVDWSAGAAVQALRHIAPDLPVTAISAAQGHWRWDQDPGARLPDLPVWTGTGQTPAWTPDRQRDALLRPPRLGPGVIPDQAVDQLAHRLGTIAAGDPVLVIGTGEHVWGPMLLAERLEQGGADVRVVATTRSPILEGEVIRHKVTFADHFGLGIPMYLHNVPPRPEARVILMTETGAAGICPVLRSYLGKGQIIDGAGQITQSGAI